MSITATHNGTCQICGAIQAASPRKTTNVLAKHGYTTRFGFFEGTCAGSGHQPFELSKNLIAEFVAKAEASIASYTTEAAALLASNTGTTIHVHHYVPAKFLGGGRKSAAGRVWRVVEVIEAQLGGRSIWGYQTTDENGNPKVYELTHRSRPVEEVVATANAAYASYLQKRAAELRIYVQWQTARLATWEVKPLLPRTAEAGAVIEPKKLTIRTKGARVRVWNGSGKPQQEGVVVTSYRDVTGFSVSIDLDNGNHVVVSSRRVSLVQEVA